ncbi:hypothetical protein SK128_024056 [Halocaridina rubra]|uniref:Ig-like domain-containing protein n=1 Tax=Halocaridina rubra TaxID=373956 RepID=A0AAN8WM70_HALRR
MIHFCFVTFILSVEPQILPFAIPEEVEEGQLIQISCAVTKGDDPLTLQWYKDGVPVVSSPDFMINNVAPKLSILLLSSANAEHTGTYSCLAFNPVGTAEVSASLKVKVEPQILPFTFPDEVEAEQLVQVSCAVSKGDAPMTLQWYKDGQPLISSPNFMISNVAPMLSLLLLTSVDAEHSGLYTCLAFNPVGTAEESAILKVKGAIKSTSLIWLPLLSNLATSHLHREKAIKREHQCISLTAIVTPLKHTIETAPTTSRLKYREPFYKARKENFDIKEAWREEWSRSLPRRGRELVEDLTKPLPIIFSPTRIQWMQATQA